MISYNIQRGHTLRIAFGITMLAFSLLIGGVGAATPISSCTTIDTPGIYVLTNSIVNSGATTCIDIISSDVTFDGAGHTIDGVNATDTYGVFVHNLTDLTNINIKNLEITDWHHGIYYGFPMNYKVENGSISNNILSSNKDGITVSYAGNISLTNNIVSSGEMIFTRYAWNINIINNNAAIGLSHTSRSTVTKNKGGISLGDSSDNNITDNDFRWVDISYGINNIIANNKITNSTEAGIALSMSRNNTITNNNISSNKYGIKSIGLFGNNNNNITNNTISSNDYGIYLKVSNNNLIYNNYFSNANNVWDDGNNTWNITKKDGINIIGGPYLGGNFWSNYVGRDTDGDWLGNTRLPYNNFGNITNGGDYLPLTQAGVTGDTIHGTVYNDANGNKIKDAGEAGLANWKIQLKGFESFTRTPVNRETVTDGDGYYRFTNLNPGIYVMSEKSQSRWILTTPPIISVRLVKGESSVVDFGNEEIKILP